MGTPMIHSYLNTVLGHFRLKGTSGGHLERGLKMPKYHLHAYPNKRENTTPATSAA